MTGIIVNLSCIGIFFAYGMLIVSFLDIGLERRISYRFFYPAMVLLIAICVQYINGRVHFSVVQTEYFCMFGIFIACGIAYKGSAAIWVFHINIIAFMVTCKEGLLYILELMFHARYVNQQGSVLTLILTAVLTAVFAVTLMSFKKYCIRRNIHAGDYRFSMVRVLVLMQFLLSFFLMLTAFFCDDYLYYSYQNAIAFMIIIYAIVMFLFFTLIVLTIEFNELGRERGENRLQKKMLKSQLLSYKNYIQYTSNLREFQKRYKDMIAQMNEDIKTGEMDKLRDHVCQTNDYLHQKVGVHKEYSNNPLLDAILQGFHNVCREEGIKAETKVYLHESFKVSDDDLYSYTSTYLDLITKIFRFLEKEKQACIHTESNWQGKWGTITTRIVLDPSITISIQSDNLILLEGGSKMENVDLSILQKRIEATGGMMRLEQEEKNEISIHLHYQSRGQ